MNLLDLLLAIIIGLSVAAGYGAGFARAGIGFIAVVTGLLFGFWFYGIPAAWIHQQISSQALSNLAGFFLVFLAFVFAGALLGKLLSKLFKWTGLSWLDRIMGAAFGLVRGALIGTGFVAVLLAFTPTPLPNWMINSKVLPYAVDAAHVCSQLAPQPVTEAFRQSMLEIRKIWADQLKKNRQDRDKEKEKDKDKAVHKVLFTRPIHCAPAWPIHEGGFGPTSPGAGLDLS